MRLTGSLFIDMLSPMISVYMRCRARFPVFPERIAKQTMK